MAPLIQLNNVDKSYVTGDVVTPVLHGVTLSIEEGEFVAIMGASGSGKSTLMNIVGFLDRLSDGEYIFRGRDVSRLKDDDLSHMRRDEIGFVFQSFNLLARTSAAENVALPLVYAEIKESSRQKMAREMLTRVGLSHRFDNAPNQLSGGEKQRVAIARALMNAPTIVLADEPTGNLDSKTGEEVLKLFQDLHVKEGRTIIMITHELEAAEFADRIIKLKDGKVVSDSGDHARRTGSFTK